MIDIIIVWAVILAFVVIMYVLLDGFDLGIGILFPWLKQADWRDSAMDTVAPVWDGNETWMVLGGALLYGAFPLAYSTLLPRLYIPIILMVVALIFRGVAFEFRFKANKSKPIWTTAFFIGSLTAAFCQGLILGTFIQGDLLDIYTLAGDPVYLWLTPFSVMTGLAVVSAYALLGATWLIAKTDGLLQDTVRQLAKRFLIVVMLFMALVSLWTPLLDPDIAQRWFSMPNFLYLLPLPLLSIIISYIAWKQLHKLSLWMPFLCSVSLFLLAFVGFGISIWPHILPHSITIWQAAAPESSLYFMLIGVGVLIPVLLSYTAYSYYVFRGKSDGYYSQ